jgi:hypothetical protein
VLASNAILGAVDMDGRLVEADLLPAEADKLADAQRVTEAHEDE